MTSKLAAAATLAVLLPLACIAHAQAGPYSVQKIQLVGGDGGFDYVTADSDGRNLYVARSGPAGHIGVFNLDTLAQVGDIPGTSSHGGAVDTATGHGFATSKPVTMFDAKTFAILKKIDVQGNPDGYLNDPYNHRFYVLSHSAPNITVLDDKDGAILGTIDIGGAPEQAATDGHGKIYVDIEDKAAIAVIDANTMKIVGKYDISSTGSGCAGLALDAKNNILFAACRDKKTWSFSRQRTGTSSPICPSATAAMAQPSTPPRWKPSARRATARSPSSKKIRRQVFEVEQTVPTPAAAKVLTLDTKTNRIYHHRRVRPNASSATRRSASTARRSTGLGTRPTRSHDSRLIPDSSHRQVSN